MLKSEGPLESFLSAALWSAVWTALFSILIFNEYGDWQTKAVTIALCFGLIFVGNLLVNYLNKRMTR